MSSFSLFCVFRATEPGTAAREGGDEEEPADQTSAIEVDCCVAAGSKAGTPTGSVCIPSLYSKLDSEEISSLPLPVLLCVLRPPCGFGRRNWQANNRCLNALSIQALQESVLGLAAWCSITPLPAVCACAFARACGSSLKVPFPQPAPRQVLTVSRRLWDKPVVFAPRDLLEVDR